MTKRNDLHCTAAVIRILDGLTDDADRARAIELAYTTPTPTEEIVAHAATAIRRWTDRAERPEFVETCARAHIRRPPCSDCPEPCPAEVDGEIPEECGPKVIVERRR